MAVTRGCDPNHAEGPEAKSASCQLTWWAVATTGWPTRTPFLRSEVASKTADRIGSLRGSPGYHKRAEHQFNLLQWTPGGRQSVGLGRLKPPCGQRAETRGRDHAHDAPGQKRQDRHHEPNQPKGRRD